MILNEILGNWNKGTQNNRKKEAKKFHLTNASAFQDADSGQKSIADHLIELT